MITALTKILLCIVLTFGILLALLLVFKVALDIYDTITEIINRGNE